MNKRVIILIFVYIDKKKVYYREGDFQNSSVIVHVKFVKFRSTLLNGPIMLQNIICFCLFVFGGISVYKSCKTVLMIVEKLMTNRRKFHLSMEKKGYIPLAVHKCTG